MFWRQKFLARVDHPPQTELGTGYLALLRRRRNRQSVPILKTGGECVTQALIGREGLARQTTPVEFRTFSLNLTSHSFLPPPPSGELRSFPCGHPKTGGELGVCGAALILWGELRSCSCKHVPRNDCRLVVFAGANWKGRVALLNIQVTQLTLNSSSAVKYKSFVWEDRELDDLQTWTGIWNI